MESTTTGYAGSSFLFFKIACCKYKFGANIQQIMKEPKVFSFFYQFTKKSAESFALSHNLCNFAANSAKH
jgi:hypothetical protein